jgi:hypothetical protein
MRNRYLILPLIAVVILVLSGCGNRELKKDAAKIGDVMCRNIEIMNKLRGANPSDTVLVAKLQEQELLLQEEMSTAYKAFNDKYKEKTKDPKFSKAFSRELRKAMLDCPSLSKKDRELFEKDLEE